MRSKTAREKVAVGEKQFMILLSCVFMLIGPVHLEMVLSINNIVADLRQKFGDGYLASHNAYLPPQFLEPRRIGGGIPDGVLNVAVTEVVLNETQVVTAIGEIEATGVPQHMRPDRR